MRENQRVYNKD